MRIYLDNCCFNRPFDDQSYDRIHLESEAILTILDLSRQGIHEIIGSDVLEVEMQKGSNPAKVEKVKALYSLVTNKVSYTPDIAVRSKEIRKDTMIQAFDSMHIASAEKGGVEVVLTTDDKLIKWCKMIDIQVKVMNPINWLMEVIDNE